MMDYVRWILELAVAISFVGGCVLLDQDWHRIEPPHWRMVILAMLTVVLANGAAIIVAMVDHRPLTWATWLLCASYAFLMAMLFRAKLHYQAPHNRRATDG